MSARELEFDIVVVGCGSAACSMVHELLTKTAPGEAVTVALLDRGPPTEAARDIAIPFFCMTTLRDPALGVRRYVKGTTPDGRDLTVSVGNVLGGGGSVNYMHYSRGGKDDYDAWSEGWRFDDLLPAFKKVEDYAAPPPPPPTHGVGGPIPVGDGLYRSPLMQKWLSAMDSVKIPVVEDIQNFNTSLGAARAPRTINPKSGKRPDPFSAFIKPLVASRPNDIHVLSHSRVLRVLFDDKLRASGVECVATGTETGAQAAAPQTIKARKMVILAAGALETAPILERSGVGCKQRLESLKIKCIADLPGVGENYLDHPLVRCIFKVTPGTPTAHDFLNKPPEEKEAAVKAFLEDNPAGKVLGTNHIGSYGRFTPTKEEWDAIDADTAKVLKPIYENKPTRTAFGLSNVDMGLFVPQDPPEKGSFATGVIVNFHPVSRGSIHITSADPTAAEAFDPGLLVRREDVEFTKWGYKKLETFLKAVPFFDGFLEWNRPKSSSDKDVEEFLKRGIASAAHPAGTAAMKPREEGGVVDTSLSVYGVKSLKVIDLSIMRDHVSAHTYLTAMAIGTTAAEHIRHELRPAAV